MSIVFSCGGVPLNFTLPVILPSPAALTLLPKLNKPTTTSSNAVSIPASLYAIFIYAFSSMRSLFALRLVVLLLVVIRLRRRVRIDWFQPELFSDFFFFLVHTGDRLQGSQVHHKIPRLVRFDVVGKRRHWCSV